VTDKYGIKLKMAILPTIQGEQMYTGFCIKEYFSVPYQTSVSQGVV
jgi:hypothetical protein